MPMARRTWKAEETWWAKRYNGKRNPITGRDDIPDVENDVLAFEVKLSKTNVSGGILRKALDQSIRAAKNTGKIPVVGIAIPGIRRKDAPPIRGKVPRERLVVMREEDWYQLYEDAEPVLLGRIKKT